MGTWAFTNGAWQMTGTAVRTVLLAAGTLPSVAALDLWGGAPAQNSKVVFWSDRNGAKSGWEAGIEGANIVIQHRTLAGSPTVVLSTPHGLTAGVVFKLQVRILNEKVECYLNGAASPILTHTNSAGIFLKYRHYGFSSAVPSAKVLKFQKCDLQPDFGQRTDALFVVAGGDAWLSLEDGQITLLKAGAFNASGPVSLVDFNQVVYGFDGSHALKCDLGVAAPVVEKFTPSAGTLPGQTDPGTTTTSIAFNFLNRIGLVVEQHLYLCASDDPNDWDTTKDLPGRAFATPADLPGKIGSPITCVIQATKGEIVIGCRNEIWRMIGDPALGIPDISPAYLKSGISSKDAAAVLADGRVIAHTPEGAVLIPVRGDPLPLSEDVLTRGIQFDRALVQQRQVVVRPDPKRHRVMFYLSGTMQGVSTEHYCYEERVGRYKRGTGGWFPDDLPAAMGPTCAEVHKGELVLGTFDGRLLRMDDTADKDDGVPFTTKFTAALLKGERADRTVKLLRTYITLREASRDLSYAVYGGRSAEEAYIGAKRWLMFAGTVKASDPDRVIRKRGRAKAIVIELSGTERVIAEELQAVFTLARIVQRRARTVPAEPAPFCRSPNDLVFPLLGGTPGPGPGPGPGLGENLDWSSSTPDVWDDGGAGATAAFAVAIGGGGGTFAQV